MKVPMPQLLKKLWETWDLRFFIMLSLSLQAVLILIAPLRRKIRAYWIVMLLWSAYLLADWTANFSVGQISSSQGKRVDSIKRGDDNADILAFWAPFLLVHLGGPDTITAFSLEDNELWIRHFLGLIFQSGAAVYVFYQSMPKNQLWLPTVLVFISGTIKYGERTRSLYLASLNRFRNSMLNPPDPGPNYAKIMNEYRSKQEAKLPAHIEMIAEPARGTKSVDKVKKGWLTEEEVVLHAHEFYVTFKGLIVDLIFSVRQRNQTRDFFLQRTSADAFKVIEVELNLIYDVLFSKVSVVYTKFGYFFRFISFSLVVTSLGLFYCEDKSNFQDPDVTITYTLLLGAIALDVIAFIYLVTSVWLKVARQKLTAIDQENTNKDSQESDAEKTSEKPGFGCFRRIEQFLHRRWSESISGYNLIFYCRKARRPPEQEKLIDSLGLTVILDEWKYVKQHSFTKELRDHIFEELKTKSMIADDLETAKVISAARGDWVLQDEGLTDLLGYVTKVNYDESLLLWHIATELCYAEKIESEKVKNYREFSKLLSDYMLYLLVMQPKMMSAVAGIGEIRFRDTCAETKNFIHNRRQKRPGDLQASLYAVKLFFKYLLWGPFLVLRSIIALIISVFVHLSLPFIYILYLVKYCCGLSKEHGAIPATAKKYSYSHVMESFLKKSDLEKKKSDLEKKQIDACKRILDVHTAVEPVTIKGDRSKSVLFDGCMLAKELKNLPNDKKWEIMSKVWVEMMCYAAIHCRANAHAQQLSKGGELVTIVWFLMAHFGLCDQFQINQGHTRAKLIVEK